MAIYHLHSKFIQRSAGGSSVAAAAYRCAEHLTDERVGVIHDYERKMGVVHTEILAPDNAPAWAHDRGALWNAAEKAERRCDGQPGREVRVALPKELSLDEQVELVREFCGNEFVKNGMVADFAIHHDNPDNPHAHIGLTTRPIDALGFGKKDRSWHTKKSLVDLREGWAVAANLALQRAGHTMRIDHRSYQDQGLRLIPTEHVGINRHQRARNKRDLVQERLDRNDAVVFQNGEAIRQDPSIALEALTHYEATFTRRSAAVWLNSRTLDDTQFQACLSRVMGHSDVVKVGTDYAGVEVFSTRTMLASEREMLSLGETLARSAAVGAAKAANVRTQVEACGLSDEQATALRHVAQRSGDLAIVEGLAGTGKSTMFRAARAVWEQEGHRVIGMALSGKAAEGLGASAGIGDCRSIAGWEWAWDRERDVLGRGDVVVVDEAGMVGTRQMERLLARAHEACAKVVLAGDSEQIQAVEAGCPFTELGKRNEKVFLRAIRRQRTEWMRDASADLARGKIGDALEAYRGRGAVHSYATQAGALDGLVEGFAAYAAKHPDKQQLVLSVRKKDVALINACIRAHRQGFGGLRDAVLYQTEEDKLSFAAGDRICFLKNDREMGVKNGTLGTVEKARQVELTVRLDGPEKRQVTVDTEHYKAFAHGYALTTHKAQGVTVDHCHVLATKAFDSRTTYVAMTRHREGLELHYGHDEFKGSPGLEAMLSRTRSKDLALSYVDAEKQNRELQGKLEAAKEAELKDAKARWRATMERGQELSKKAIAAQHWAKTQALTLRDGFERTPEGAAVTQDLREALATQRYWEQQSALAKTQHRFKAAFGLSDSVEVRDPTFGQPMRIDDGLKRSAGMANRAQSLYDRAWHDPYVQRQAQELIASHNANIAWGKQAPAQIAAELRQVERVRDALPRSARPEYLPADERQRAKAQERLAEQKAALADLQREEAKLRAAATRAPMTFEQGLRAQPAARVALRRVEAATHRQQRAQNAWEHLKQESLDKAKPVSELLKEQVGPTGKTRGELLREADKGAAQEIRDAKKGLEETLGDPALQKAASAWVAKDKAEQELAQAKLPDMEMKRQKLDLQILTQAKEVVRSRDRGMDLGL